MVAMAVVALSLGCTVAEAAPKKQHALVRVGKALAFVPKQVVTHPKQSVKLTLGSVLFAAESVNDVVYSGLVGLDKAAGMELKFNPFHYVAVLDGKIDVGLEAGELYFYGSS